MQKPGIALFRIFSKKKNWEKKVKSHRVYEISEDEKNKQQKILPAETLSPDIWNPVEVNLNSLMKR